MNREHQLIHQQEDQNRSMVYLSRAWEISNELNKQLLTLSTGVIAALFFALLDTGNQLDFVDRILTLGAIIQFGLSVFCSIMAMQLEVRRHEYLAEQVKAKAEEEEDDAERGEKLTKRHRWADRWSRRFFIMGILTSITVLLLSIVI